jgi:hypothetical protein
VKTEQFPACFHRHLDGWLELSHKGHVVFRELRERPGSDRSLLLAHMFTWRRFLARNQPGISISHDDGTIQLAQALQCFGWLRSSLKRITQAHYTLNTLLAYIFEHPVKCKTVPVQI